MACKLARSLYDRRERAAQRAERVLVEFYTGKKVAYQRLHVRKQPLKEGSLMSRVEALFNGKPLAVEVVCGQFPDQTRHKVTMALLCLRRDKRLVRVGRGVYQKPEPI